MGTSGTMGVSYDAMIVATPTSVRIRNVMTATCRRSRYTGSR